MPTGVEPAGKGELATAAINTPPAPMVRTLTVLSPALVTKKWRCSICIKGRNGRAAANSGGESGLAGFQVRQCHRAPGAGDTTEQLSRY